jgi:hypothetical protein
MSKTLQRGLREKRLSHCQIERTPTNAPGAELQRDGAFHEQLDACTYTFSKTTQAGPTNTPL